MKKFFKKMWVMDSSPTLWREKKNKKIALASAMFLYTVAY